MSSRPARLLLSSYGHDFERMLHEGMTQCEGMMLCNGDTSTRRRLLYERTMLGQMIMWYEGDDSAQEDDTASQVDAAA